MAIALDIAFGGAQGSGTASTSNATPTVNGLMIAVVCFTGTFGTITDSYGNTYTQQGSVFPAPSGVNLALFTAPNTTHVSGHVTATSSANVSVGAGNFSGLAASNQFDRSAFQTGGPGTALSSPSTATTSFPNELLIGFGTQNTGTSITWTVGSGYTTVSKAQVGGIGLVFYMIMQIVSVQGSYAATETSSVSATWGAGIATFSDTPVQQGDTSPGQLIYILP